MEQYIAIIKDDIKRFIKNYLIAGELVDMTGMSDLEEYIPSKYPYLSILYLLKRNGLNKDETWFVENYNSQLIDETGELKRSLGHFLWNKKDVDALTAQLLKMKNQVSSLSQEIGELKIQKEKLKSQNISLEEENLMLKQKVDDLTSMIEKLESSQNSAKNISKVGPQDVQEPELIHFSDIQQIAKAFVEKIAKGFEVIDKEDNNQVPQTTLSNECDDIFGKTPSTEKKYRWQTDSFNRIIENDRIKHEEERKRREEERKRIQEEKERDEMKEKFYRKQNKKIEQRRKNT